jgi:hypothetical protein
MSLRTVPGNPHTTADKGCSRCGRRFGWLGIFNLGTPKEYQLCEECLILIYGYAEAERDISLEMSG